MKDLLLRIGCTMIVLASSFSAVGILKHSSELIALGPVFGGSGLVLLIFGILARSGNK